MQILKPIDIWEVENPKKFMTKAHDYSEVISLNVTKRFKWQNILSCGRFNCIMWIPYSYDAPLIKIFLKRSISFQVVQSDISHFFSYLCKLTSLSTTGIPFSSFIFFFYETVE